MKRDVDFPNDKRQSSVSLPPSDSPTQPHFNVPTSEDLVRARAAALLLRGIEGPEDRDRNLLLCCPNIKVRQGRRSAIRNPASALSQPASHSLNGLSTARLGDPHGDGSGLALLLSQSIN